jgi:anti-sigma factor RsiW
MPCEHYKDALIEAAATGAGPQGELRAHLAACTSCRAAFEQEQSLFTAIDSGLHATANDEAPPSFLPRVRAGLDEVAVAPPPRWLQPLVFASAGVALAFVVFLIARPYHATPENVVRQGPVFAPTAITPGTNANPGKIPAAAAETASTGANPSHRMRNSTFFHPVASSNPEVLVPPDEREAFARFVVALRGRGEVALALVTPTVQTKEESPSIEPLQIKLLDEQQTESSDGAQQKF